ncbi:hypothetical protein BCR34DRAFT_582880 [Clohesyomyces aquaticus]|uniref:TNFR-Cys domain-containing protein n=1 Tax=Clohesyomyces aquaticus TaxID=1231657 RepID=A0A1Y2A7Y7_9PLEO|nr:hypothetical protein BCR34DRAFT_582880 [Clohesyomyces aquaticus]
MKFLSFALGLLPFVAAVAILASPIASCGYTCTAELNACMGTQHNGRKFLKCQEVCPKWDNCPNCPTCTAFGPNSLHNPDSFPRTLNTIRAEDTTNSVSKKDPNNCAACQNFYTDCAVKCAPGEWNSCVEPCRMDELEGWLFSDGLDTGYRLDLGLIKPSVRDKPVIYELEGLM